jgi:hypothetical protein
VKRDFLWIFYLVIIRAMRAGAVEIEAGPSRSPVKRCGIFGCALVGNTGSLIRKALIEAISKRLYDVNQLAGAIHPQAVNLFLDQRQVGKINNL